MPEDLLGQFVYVYWEKDDVWYRGCIQKYHDTSLKFTIHYDDKHVERIDFQKQHFFIDDEANRTFGAPNDFKKKRGRKAKKSLKVSQYLTKKKILGKRKRSSSEGLEEDLKALREEINQSNEMIKTQVQRNDQREEKKSFNKIRIHQNIS